jgi:hypothetical protein
MLPFECGEGFNRDQVLRMMLFPNSFPKLVANPLITPLVQSFAYGFIQVLGHGAASV